MVLSELIRHVTVDEIMGNTQVDVTGLTHDSRQVMPGNVFVAIPGLKHDGAEYARSAQERGAVAVVAETLTGGHQACVSIRVPHARRAMGQMARAFHGFPDRALKVVGITGTNGKTTTAFLIRHLLGAVGFKTGLLGTVVYDDGDKEIPASRTTPESIEVCGLMARMVGNGCRACVMEVSSHALEQGRVEGLAFDVAVFTNLTQDHLDYHKTFDAYFDAKSLLFSGLNGAEKKSVALINVDDPWAERLIGRVHPSAQTVTYGFGAEAGLRAELVELGSSRTRYILHNQGRAHEVTLPLAGRHNVYNSLAAVGTALALGIDPVTVISALAALPAVPGRLERVDAGMPFDLFVDYAHTDDALKNVLSTLRETTRGRIITVFGCGGNRDAKKRPLMGAVAAEWSDHTIVTSDNPRREEPASIIAAVVEGFGAKKNFETIEDRREAIARALEIARPGDTVLLAGKGHETYQEFADEVVPFDDREVVRELAAERLAGKEGAWTH
ncbi:UDP-N-acetylmuramoyl-L-alanyl-D-glutamate--2,6-diaminopimelate ligase [Oscillatoria amoena NRMC-F 0135]|nr:UDP-N-acetylmuramoyl-L-alanyl-D-glutamate--2,6-diaminopimelate ligase [Oscillatoria amoena NRMC-F 0135]